MFLLGKSGSGKSTLLNAIGGLDKFDGGEIIIKGKSSADFTQADFDSYRNTFIGFIFQEYNILENFSVAKNLALALELQGKKADKEESSGEGKGEGEGDTPPVQTAEEDIVLNVGDKINTADGAIEPQPEGLPVIQVPDSVTKQQQTAIKVKPDDSKSVGDGVCQGGSSSGPTFEA